MAGILVYIPQGSTADKPQEQLVRVGLGPLLDRSVDPLLTEIRTGPDGGAGVLVTFDGIGLPPTPREFNASTQTWGEAPPAGELPKGRFWLGYVNGAKPTAGELQRAELFDGEPVILRDGNGWLIPISELLPKLLQLDPNSGVEVRTVDDCHREFAEFANAIFELFMSDGFRQLVEKERRISIPRGMTFAAMALAKNYRVTVEVIDLLKLVGEMEAFEIARVATGMSAIERILAQKKSTERSFQLTGSN